jgi:hypothetical protein
MGILRLIVLLLIFISLSRTGTACACAPPIPEEEDRMIRAEIDSSDIVFRGEIVAHKGGAAVFRIHEKWKGNLRSYVRLEWRRGDRGDCNGFWPDDLKVGNELLVFANKGPDGIYRTSICRPTGFASKAGRVLDLLGPGKPIPSSHQLVR